MTEEYKQLYEQVCEQYDVLAKELEATNRQVEILSDALAESRREVVTPFTIQFHSHPATEVLRLTKDGIWANPDIPADDAAKLVLEAIDHNIKILVQKAVLAEREACAQVVEAAEGCAQYFPHVPDIIRARGNT